MILFDMILELDSNVGNFVKVEKTILKFGLKRCDPVPETVIVNTAIEFNDQCSWFAICSSQPFKLEIECIQSRVDFLFKFDSHAF